MNDSVREELQTKVAASVGSGSLAAPPKISRPLPPVETVKPKPLPFVHSAIQKPSASAPQKPAVPAAPKPATPRTVTTDLGVKKTSPTLVGFQSKNATLPDWRLQLQNSVRQRSTGASPVAQTEAKSEQRARKQTTSGANALKIESAPEPTAPAHANPRVANALKRIEESRRAFLEVPGQNISPGSKPDGSAARSFPFNVVSRAPHALTDAPSVQLAKTSKPRLVSSLRIEKRSLDTNKLPPLPQPARVATSLDGDDAGDLHRSDGIDIEQRRFEVKAEPVREVVEAIEQPAEF